MCYSGACHCLGSRLFLQSGDAFPARGAPGRVACMDLVRRGGVGLYQAATGDGGAPLDPVEQFMVEDWLADLERKRADAGATTWLP